MQTVVLEFSDRQALEEAVRHLWERLQVSGELVTSPTAEGRWRLEIVSERPLRSATLEKLGGRLLAE